MTGYAALLRAINVGGTVKLPMSDLTRLCEEAGFEAVKTYIASGNVVFKSPRPEAEVKAELEARLKAYAGRDMPLVVRSAAELAQILADNPYADKSPTYTVAILLDQAPPKDALDKARHQASEVFTLGRREIYVHYPDGQGRSKLVIPDAKLGTARNMNTIKTLAEMAALGRTA